MKFMWNEKKEGIQILRCFGYDGQLQLPNQIEGRPVTQLGPYVFSETVKIQEPGEKQLTDLSDGEETTISLGSGLYPEILEDGTPAVKGDVLTSIRLPAYLWKIGAYAFYHCEKVNQLVLPAGLWDLGAGLFTGCRSIEYLKVHMIPGTRSCLKEVLAELRQTLRVDCLDGSGRLQAKLLFPEYFEESVENTPARILTQEMHGCGHRYRNAFNGTEFQYGVYDRLFPHIQVQEKPELVTELVLGRLMYPVQLSDERRAVYEAYADEHGREIVRVADEQKNGKILSFSAQAPWCSKRCLEEMLAEANQIGDPQAMGILMDIRHERQEKETDSPKADRRRRFELV